MATGGYESVAVTPWETASAGKAVVCRSEAGCSLSAPITQPEGHYDVAVQYFDTWRGISVFDLLVNGKSVAKWSADDTLPPAQFDPHLDGQTSTRFTAQDVFLKPGDTLMLKGMPDLREELNEPSKEAADPGSVDPHARERRDYREFAPVDYIQLGPNSALTPQD
jgi:alpha-glucuronidase